MLVCLGGEEKSDIEKLLSMESAEGTDSAQEDEDLWSDLGGIFRVKRSQGKAVDRA